MFSMCAYSLFQFVLINLSYGTEVNMAFVYSSLLLSVLNVVLCLVLYLLCVLLYLSLVLLIVLVVGAI